MRRIIASCILAILVFALAACGSDLPPHPALIPSPPSMPSPNAVVTSAPYVSVETTTDAPAWEVALEEFLLEFLPIFSPVTFERTYTFVDEAFPNWEQTGRYFADPITEERIAPDAVPYIMTLQGEFEGGEAWSITYIAVGFSLLDIDEDGIPELLVQYALGDFWFEVLFRYIDGKYVAVPTFRRHFEQEDPTERVNLFFHGPSAISEFFARDSTGRLIVLGAGGAGGLTVSGYVADLSDVGIHLAPIFNMRHGWWEGSTENEFRLWVDDSITGELTSLPEVDEYNFMFFPWDWPHGESDMTPVSIPVMPDVTVTPLLRLIDLEQQLTERITARLLAEGRILPH